MSDTPPEKRPAADNEHLTPSKRAKTDHDDATADSANKGRAAAYDEDLARLGTIRQNGDTKTAGQDTRVGVDDSTPRPRPNLGNVRQPVPAPALPPKHAFTFTADTKTTTSSTGNVRPPKPQRSLPAIEEFPAPGPRPQPCARKSIAGHFHIRDIDKPATTPFPNPAGLKHPSLAIVEFQIGQLVAPDSDYDLMKTKNEEIVKRSNDHEREVNDLLRTARKANQDAMVCHLECELVDTRERRVRAEKVLEGSQELEEKLERMTGMVLELDDEVVDVVRRLDRLLGGEAREG